MSSIMAQDAGVLALLADTSRAGYGSYGYGHGSFGNLSANAVRTNTVLDAVNRNGEDAHFFALSSEDRTHFNILNQQNQDNQLAEQAQISQLALQLCQCCNDKKFEVGKIDGKIECLGSEVALLIKQANVNQDCEDLLGQIAVLQNGTNMAQSNDQHAQILGVLGQIAGALAGLDGDDGDGGHRKCKSKCKRKRCRRCRRCECKCECGVTVNVRTIHGNNNFSDRGGGGGIEEEIADESESDDNEAVENGDNDEIANEDSEIVESVEEVKTVNGRSAPAAKAIAPAAKAKAKK